MIMTASAYLRLFLATTFVVVGSVFAFNYWADPCGIYHFGKPWDWIQSRPAIKETIFLHKASAVLQARADILFLGNSRTADGLDPHNPALPGRAYNLGLYQGTI